MNHSPVLVAFEGNAGDVVGVVEGNKGVRQGIVKEPICS